MQRQWSNAEAKWMNHHRYALIRSSSNKRRFMRILSSIQQSSKSIKSSFVCEREVLFSHNSHQLRTAPYVSATTLLDYLKATTTAGQHAASDARRRRMWHLHGGGALCQGLSCVLLRVVASAFAIYVGYFPVITLCVRFVNRRLVYIGAERLLFTCWQWAVFALSLGQKSLDHNGHPLLLFVQWAEVTCRNANVCIWSKCKRETMTSRLLQVLDCEHTICVPCAGKLVRSADTISIECPTCRQSTIIDQGLDDLPNRYFGDIKCDVCLEKKSTNDMWWCRQCVRALCSKCSIKGTLHYCLPTICSSLCRT